jgi:hypothetical protein
MAENDSYTAIMDGELGMLQWLGIERSQHDAIRKFFADIGFNADVAVELIVLPNLSGREKDALQEWHENGSSANEYPAGLPGGVRYTAAEIAQIMRS